MLVGRCFDGTRGSGRRYGSLGEKWDGLTIGGCWDIGVVDGFET